MPNPNENCLAGMKCPECGSYGPFAIEVGVVVEMTDDGHDFDFDGNTNWDDKSYINCQVETCHHSGKVADFREATP